MLFRVDNYLMFTEKGLGSASTARPWYQFPKPVRKVIEDFKKDISAKDVAVVGKFSFWAWQ